MEHTEEQILKCDKESEYREDEKNGDDDRCKDMIKEKKRRKHKKHRRRPRKEDDNSQDLNLVSWKINEDNPRTPCSMSIPQRFQDIPDSYPEAPTHALLGFLESKIYRFDDGTCSANIKCSSNTAQRDVSKQSTDGARGLVGFQDGRHVLEMTFDDRPWGSHCAVGLVTATVPLQSNKYTHLMGENDESWCWDIPSRKLRHAGTVTEDFPYNEKEEISRVIKLIVDRERKTFSLDAGQGDAVIFNDLPDSNVVLYPAVSMVYGLFRVTVKVLESSLYSKYCWLPEAYRELSNNQSPTDIYTGSNKADVDHQKEFDSMGYKENLTEDRAARNEPDTGIATITDFEQDNLKVMTATELENGAIDVEQKTKERFKVNGAVERHDDGMKDDVQTNKIGDGPICDNNPLAALETGRAQAFPEPLPRSTDLELCAQLPSSSEANEGNSRTEDRRVEEEPFQQESLMVSELPEYDQYLVQLAHGWDLTNKGSLVQPYPNVPYICVPMPNLQSRIQGIRCRQGFTGRGEHTWRVRELLMYSPNLTLPLEEGERLTNSLIIGVASKEQRKYNFGFSMPAVGDEVWGLEYPDMRLWHGNHIYSVQSSETDDVNMLEGLEMTLSTASHKLTFTFQGREVAEMAEVEGQTLYPFVLYHADAHWPLEIKYLEGPKDYVEETIAKMREASKRDKQDVNNVRILMKRSSSHREITDPAGIREKYVWGKFSPSLRITDKYKTTVSGGQGAALAHSPLGDSSRHKINFVIDGSTHGLSIILVHPDYPMENILKTGAPYNWCLGNDLLSWRWDVEAGLLYHAGRVIGRYPVDPGFDPSDVTTYSLTLNFTQLGYNTAAFTAHYRGSKQPMELGIAFVCLASKIVPGVVMRGRQQSVRLEYVSGPWKGEVKTAANPQSSSSVCNIL